RGTTARERTPPAVARPEMSGVLAPSGGRSTQERGSLARRERRGEGRFGRIAVDREDHVFQCARLVPPDRADHDLRGSIKRKSAHTRAERHKRERAAAQLVGLGKGGFR